MIRYIAFAIYCFFALSTSPLRAEEGKAERAKELVKETAHDVADATKKAATVTKEKAVELYDKAAAGTKHAAEVTTEKSRDAYAVTKEATIKAKDKTVEVSKVVADKALEAGRAVTEKTKEAAEVTKEKAAGWTSTKEEITTFDTNKDGRLDTAERAAMKAARDKAAVKK
ncbi:MAG: hypothetical protein ABIV50_06035 [Opitutus sp.]